MFETSLWAIWELNNFFAILSSLVPLNDAKSKVSPFNLKGQCMLVTQNTSDFALVFIYCFQQNKDATHTPRKWYSQLCTQTNTQSAVTSLVSGILNPQVYNAHLQKTPHLIETRIKARHYAHINGSCPLRGTRCGQPGAAGTFVNKSAQISTSRSNWTEKCERCYKVTNKKRSARKLTLSLSGLHYWDCDNEILPFERTNENFGILFMVYLDGSSMLWTSLRFFFYYNSSGSDPANFVMWNEVLRVQVTLLHLQKSW